MSNLLLVALVAALGAASFLAPWKTFFENGLEVVLRRNGFEKAEISISALRLHSLELSKLSWNEGLQNIAHVALRFSSRGLLSGHIEKLEASGIDIKLRKQEDLWALDGSRPQKSEPFAPSHLANLPLEALRIDNAHISLAAEAWTASIPFAATARWGQEPRFSLEAKNGTLKAGDLSLDFGAIKTDAVFSTTGLAWDGTWNAENIAVSTPNIKLPVLFGKGAFFADDERVAASGTLESQDAQVKATASVKMNLAEPAHFEAFVSSASFPWSEGTIAVQNVHFNLADRKRIAFPLLVRKVSLDAVLQQIAGGRASGTGRISGSIPLGVDVDGSLFVQDGKLEAEGPGIIRIDQDLLPGDTPHIDFVRNVMKNLHYSRLVLEIKSEAQNRTSLVLRIEGRNPDVSEGRPVHLNVNLKGDVLNLVQQNMLSLINPQKFLERTKHAKP